MDLICLMIYFYCSKIIELHEMILKYIVKVSLSSDILDLMCPPVVLLVSPGSPYVSLLPCPV